MKPTVSDTNITLYRQVGTALHLTQFTWPFLCTIAPTPSKINLHLGAAWKLCKVEGCSNLSVQCDSFPLSLTLSPSCQDVAYCASLEERAVLLVSLPRGGSRSRPFVRRCDIHLRYIFSWGHLL